MKRLSSIHIFAKRFRLALLANMLWISYDAGSLVAQNASSVPAVNTGATALQEFQRRTSEYLRLHKKVAGTLKPLKVTTASQEIVDHQRRLAQGITSARQAARQGEIFTEPVASEFRRLIKVAMKGANGANIRASLARSGPVRFEVFVNAPYPPGMPLQSSPPTILMNLPRLPAELDYRIVGNALVLRDVKANIIVDFMPVDFMLKAMPRITGG